MSILAFLAKAKVSNRLNDLAIEMEESGLDVDACNELGVKQQNATFFVSTLSGRCMLVCWSVGVVVILSDVEAKVQFPSAYALSRQYLVELGMDREFADTSAEIFDRNDWFCTQLPDCHSISRGKVYQFFAGDCLFAPMDAWASTFSSQILRLAFGDQAEEAASYLGRDSLLELV